MKLPLSWLADYVDIDDSVEGICDKLIFSGIEVEDIESIGANFDGLVVGEITAADPHPDAEKLQVCTVSDGSERFQVVCGAPNARAGLKTAFARVGSSIGGKKMKKAKLRGVQSFGMLCSGRELGLSADHSGIMELPAEATTGSDLKELTAAPEIVLDVDITPNRGDCLSIIGVARELAALYGLPLQRPAVDFTETGPDVNTKASVEVQNPELCPRYIGRVLTGANIAPAPDWMQRRLELAGVRPINNIVDITNFVMLETGQPLHAFDHSLVAGSKIIVRSATEGEKMKTLDEAEHILSPERLLICDAERPVALAGVMGGLDSEVKDTTTDILLESAAFHQTSVRATAHALKLHTESSNRFARGCDIGNADYASRRATALLVEHAGATVCAGAIDVGGTAAVPSRQLSLGLARCDSLIGIEVPRDEIRRIFEALEFGIVEQNDTHISVEIPSFRNDLTREVDLIEEVARMHGLDKIPAPAPRAELVPGADDTPYRAERTLREKLVGLGLFQAMNYKLTSPELLDALDPGNAADRIVLPYPMSSERSVLRTSLIPQMVESLARNHTRQVTEAALFELGPAFTKSGEGAEETYTQHNRVAIGLLGPVTRAGLNKMTPVTAEEQFFALKGIIDQLGAISCKPASDPAFETAAELIFRGKAIGKIGVVSKKVRNSRVGKDKWRMLEPIAVAEFDYEGLLSTFGKVVKPKTISEYPASRRDTALVLDAAVSYDEVVRVIKKAAPNELVALDLFDVYEGDKLPDGKKSLAFRLTYQSPDRTLKDEDCTAFQNAIKAALRKQLGADVPEDA